MPLAVEMLARSGAAPQAASLEFTQAHDERVERRFGQLLSDTACGPLRVEVGQVLAAHPTLDDDESYTLTSDAAGLLLCAATTRGALHGLVTVAQRVQSGALDGRGWRVTDAPRFPWRGLCLDVARHFYTIESLRQIIDGMAWLKLNVLHLHLTDDQAFRWRSDAFPELAGDECYSSGALRALVEYAANRGVRVVPELDVPGHVTSWLVSHPEWGLHAVEATQRFGVHQACLDPTNEEVYRALERLFFELTQVFPDPFVHIGGDEVHPAWWRGSEAHSGIYHGA